MMLIYFTWLSGYEGGIRLTQKQENKKHTNNNDKKYQIKTNECYNECKMEPKSTIFFLLLLWVQSLVRQGAVTFWCEHEFLIRKLVFIHLRDTR